MSVCESCNCALNGRCQSHHITPWHVTNINQSWVGDELGKKARSFSTTTSEAGCECRVSAAASYRPTSWAENTEDSVLLYFTLANIDELLLTGDWKQQWNEKKSSQRFTRYRRHSLSEHQWTTGDAIALLIASNSTEIEVFQSKNFCRACYCWWKYLKIIYGMMVSALTDVWEQISTDCNCHLYGCQAITHTSLFSSAWNIRTCWNTSTLILVSMFTGYASDDPDADERQDSSLVLQRMGSTGGGHCRPPWQLDSAVIYNGRKGGWPINGWWCESLWVTAYIINQSIRPLTFISLTSPKIKSLPICKY